ncbi:protein NUCLEAR FUSION DEFECTIVE 6, chloroplastic/mitochondrial-like isoform X2 [Phalaenopsis equestris]|uniref:protein NUCLEAR FUSION DEFECTIVE 6, chloroplastic/mitochondrial-like isoform X2 n=1 Tax=Phalaenopsis equestris TaxID=78828 RepID=UPI0009E1FBA6|nr:protein NUCLEAR FUSION DEFECTIVE 6, chloroplastic/mitochondrial-like isoform X2 [Phalaenopsis equestris]
MAAATAVRPILRSAAIRNATARFASKTSGARSPCLIPKLGSTTPRFLRSSVVSCLCLESVLPMHSATSSALMISLLSISTHDIGFLSKGYANDDV